MREPPTTTERLNLILGLESGTIHPGALEKGRDGRFTTWGAAGKVHAYTQGPIGPCGLLAVLKRNAQG